jgi:ribosome-associated toxin RatA of RatAB toxin-antitoxin module
MPVVEREIQIEVAQAAVFALTQDYYLRLEWDPFLRDLRFLDGATGPAPGVRVWVRAHNRLQMQVEYVTVQPPERVAVRMVRGPFFFQAFAGTWLFKRVSERSTRVIFRYGFQTRWRWLRPLLDRIIAAVFAREITARVNALKHAAEETNIIERIA